MSGSLLGLLPAAASQAASQRARGLLDLSGPDRSGGDDPRGTDGIRGLLSDPLLGLAAGLLSAAGPSREPISLGQGLARGLQLSSGLEQSRLENEATRQALTARQRQREARQGLLDRLQQGGGLEDRETLGLLAQAEPELFASGLMGQLFPETERAAPAAIRTMRALGIPLTEEGFQRFNEISGGDERVLEQLKARQLLNQAQLDRLEIQRLEREGKQEEAAERRERLERRQSASRILDITNDLDRINTALAESPIGGTGQGFGLDELRRSAGGLGGKILEEVGVEGAQKAADQFAEFNQLSSELLNLAAQERDAGNITNAQFRVLADSKPSIGLTTEANRRAIESFRQKALDVFEREGIEPPLEAIPDERQERPTRGPSSPRPSEIRRMNRRQLDSLDPSQLSDEALNAAAERAEELLR